jgi:Uma2 family endonuclease
MAKLPLMPPAPTGTKLLTVDDYRATPDGTRYQLVEGELIMSPSPTNHHQTIIWNFSQIFGEYLKKNAVGKVYLAPFDVYLSRHNVVQPDVLFVAHANRGIIAEDGVHGPPDIAIEVLSPSNAHLDKKAKRQVYTREGVKELWLVDPLLLQIQIYDLKKAPTKPIKVLEEDESFSSPLLPGLTVSAADVFRR